MDRDTAEPRVDELPGERAEQWVEYHHEFAAPSTYVYEFVWDRTRPAEGPFCTDVDGNVLLDFTSHVAAAPLGYNNPKIMEPLREFDLVDPLKIAGQDFYVAGGDAPGEGIPGPSELMDRLTDATDHYDMDTVFLSNSGAEAVENALKISYDHADGAKYGITFQGAFHGRTLGALSLNRSKEVYRRRFPEISSIHDVPFCQDRDCTAETCSCGFFVDGVSRLREKLHPDRGYINPEEIAYLILEPIQGEGGYRFPSDAFADEIAALTDEYDITLVADEIQSGVGRTGKMWGADHYAIEPDVIASAKALRVGATVSRSDVFPDERSRLSSTWGAGDILSSAQGALTFDAIEEYDLLSNARTRGRQFLETMRDADLAGVEDVRGKGLMLAVEFESKELRDEVHEAAFARGLLTLSCGYKVLRILPPLDVTEREIEIGCDLLQKAVRDVS
ncbi:aminotransferase class III-fold pyridoxal phosphate-dependent enzyme [Halalkaliarchaeum sp. AArc-GB]|uniref:aminotransferase class III-fold pyridoxal phosphate-dependent enzyme n=1 Tax=Halalkaliarchaeum sp. AArc-GB TaxID=3074078 RepID=UPI002862B3B0|nr:aminotransferase class III-fold pyridoxal phosphate-dependent enzyme [Halalkaliarchaeum sp. AArc-GB]MDR5673192.1 aminotransferase class III-fold pyridoxal phosphate-dependent enzyme [Halalkaliarchaeum sp. AArc-GB]